MCVCVCVCVCVSVCVHVCIHVCVYVYVCVGEATLIMYMYMLYLMQIFASDLITVSQYIRMPCMCMYSACRRTRSIKR